MTPGPGAALAPVLAALSGLALLVAHPPLGLWPATFAAPALLLAALEVDDRAARRDGRRRRSGRLGLLAGAATFGPMLTWLVLPAGYLGWGLLALVQAGWIGVLGLLLGRCLHRWWLAPATAVAWAGVDAWRAVVPLNGFEWGAIPYAHVDGSWLLPLARLVGGRGITLVVVLLSALAFEVARRAVDEVAARDAAGPEEVLATLRGRLGALVGVLLLSVLATIEPPPTTGSLDVLAVQGNDVRHWEEPDPNPPRRITTAMHDLTERAVADGGEPDLTVWPESSVDRDISSEAGASLRPLVAATVERVPRLLAGSKRDGDDPETEWRNTALLYEDGLPPEQAYVKHRPVPFGEYLPFREWLDWFPPLDQIPRDAQPGPRGQTLELARGDAEDVRLGVLICFETLFADLARDNLHGGGDPAQLLVVLTNNASFGDSAQPAQHLAQTRLRAVETGRWAVHGAISGASAFVDPEGGAHQVTEPFELATIRRSLPLVEEPTPFLATGDLLGPASRVLVAAGAAALLAVALSERRRGGPGGVG